jgi:enoyl-CoA hydratase/carnithine racemase
VNAIVKTGIKSSVRDNVGWIELDGADRLNPIGTSTYTDIASAVRDFDSDVQVRAVVIHGAGRAFSAGADIAEISSFADRAQFETFIHGFTDALDVLASSPLPVIAAVHGAAFGGGLELALACDLRVATADAKLGLPEAKLGVLPGAGGTQRLPRIVPLGVATEMLMLGVPISGRRGYDVGLINVLAETGNVVSCAAQLARQLADGSAQVPAALKSLLRATLTLPLADGIEGERTVAADLFDSADGREGFAAFVAKRAPSFSTEVS